MYLKLDVIEEQGTVTVLGRNEAVKRVIARADQEAWEKFHADDPFKDETPCWQREEPPPEDVELVGYLEGLCAEI